MHRVGLFAALLAAYATFATPARADAPTILVDGVAARTDVPAIAMGGHVLVPLRGVFERFGAAIDFDAKNDLAILRRAGTEVRVAGGTSDAWINGRHVTLDVPAREFGGRIEVPLRFVAEALGVSVDYDAMTNTVVIVSGFKQGNFVAAGPGTPAAQGSSSSAYGSPLGGAPQVPSVSAPSVEDERPSPNALVGSQYPQIYARFAGGSSSVDPTTVRIVVDGVDVTAYATVSSAYVAYTPATPLDGGTHQVEVSGQNIDGAPFDERWSFRVDSGMSSSYVASAVGFAPSSFGVPRFGFFPPGFSVFAPGPQFFVEDEPIVIVFFSPFFNGNGFFTISGIPGQFQMTPWLGCPGFFWSTLTVPAGIFDPNAVVAAHFSTMDGRKVLVHSTAPLRLDGTRRSLPADLRFAVRARLVNRPATPRMLVAFNHVAPIARTLPVVRTAVPLARRMPVGNVAVRPIVRRPMPAAVVRPLVIMPVIRAPLPLAPVVLPLVPMIQIAPPAPQPAPKPIPIKPIPH